MADITKCYGTDCPMKDTCYRFTATMGTRQSMFTNVPFTFVNGEFECKYYWEV